MPIIMDIKKINATSKGRVYKSHIIPDVISKILMIIAYPVKSY